MGNFLLISSALALLLGFLLRGYERRRYGRMKHDPKRLTALQVVYSVLLAYPFCAAYLWIETTYLR